NIFIWTLIGITAATFIFSVLHQLQRRPSLLRHPHTLLGILHRRPASHAANRHENTQTLPKSPRLDRRYSHHHRGTSLRRQHRLPRLHSTPTSHWCSTVPTLRVNTTPHRYLLVGITETRPTHGRLVLRHLPMALAPHHRGHLPNRTLHLAIQTRSHRTNLPPISRITTTHRRPPAPCQTLQNPKTRLHPDGIQHGHHRRTHLPPISTITTTQRRPPAPCQTLQNPNTRLHPDGIQHGHHRRTHLLHPPTPGTKHQPRSHHRRMHRRQRTPQQLRQQRTRRPTRHTPNPSPKRSRRARIHRMYRPRRLHRLRSSRL